MLDLVAKNRPGYNFSEPLEPEGAVPGDPLFSEIVATKAFQRLKSIRFLGGIDYALVRSPNGAKSNIRHTRYQHSLGVARLALLYCDIRGISFVNRRLIYAAALLHDIGHAPLSHSLEPIFKEEFGISHHAATADLIAGRVPLGRELFEILRNNKVDVERVIAIISGDEPDYDGFFVGPINFDTIDGILRVHAYKKPNPVMPNPEAITEAAIQRSNDADRALVDQFWSYKNLIYQRVINSRLGVMSDFACRMFMLRHLKEVTKCDYFTTEEKIFRKLPGLYHLLASSSFESDLAQHVDSPIRYEVRKFFIDSSMDFFAHDDKGRYRQSKEVRFLMPCNDDTVEVTKGRQDRFDV